jgi:hypothetical protein
MSRQDETRRGDGWYAIGAAFCVVVSFSFPFLLSRVEMPGPPPPPTAAQESIRELEAHETQTTSCLSTYGTAQENS